MINDLIGGLIIVLSAGVTTAYLLRALATRLFEYQQKTIVSLYDRLHEILPSDTVYLIRRAMQYAEIMLEAGQTAPNALDAGDPDYDEMIGIGDDGEMIFKSDKER